MAGVRNVHILVVRRWHEAEHCIVPAMVEASDASWRVVVESPLGSCSFVGRMEEGQIGGRLRNFHLQTIRVVQSTVQYMRGSTDYPFHTFCIKVGTT